MLFSETEVAVLGYRVAKVWRVLTRESVGRVWACCCCTPCCWLDATKVTPGTAGAGAGTICVVVAEAVAGAVGGC